MNLKKKKALAVKVLGVGRDRVWFNPERLAEIKEAITRQDITDLAKQNVIKIKEITGTRKKKKRKTRRRAGKVSKKVKPGKRGYIIKIRKMRRYLRTARARAKIDSATYRKLRNYAKSGVIKDIKHLQEMVK